MWQVLLLLSRATQQRAAGPHGATADPLVKTCLQAQAWLRSLLHSHDQTAHAQGSPDPEQWAEDEAEGQPPTLAEASLDAQYADVDMEGVGGTHAGGGGGGAQGVQGETVLTWTGEMGAQDVHSRLYGEERE